MFKVDKSNEPVTISQGSFQGLLIKLNTARYGATLGVSKSEKLQDLILQKNGPTEEEFGRLLVTKNTFLNYYLNAPVSYVEQDIERIKGTFQHLDAFIEKETVWP
ncbi:hypothetical protein A0256_08970 [Mucilaginibacter sp. PAMC 26640]|nr:hypothetical protein A0256_08970 [Mucilaginibacter sp. PAMC 26640]